MAGGGGRSRVEEGTRLAERNQRGLALELLYHLASRPLQRRVVFDREADHRGRLVMVGRQRRHAPVI